VLRDINKFAEKRSSRKWATHFLTHKTDAGIIADYRGKLKQAIDEFSVRLKLPLHTPEYV
jgi:hypothetical protein